MSHNATKLDERLAELLVEWEESVVAGTPLTPAVLCRECPELVVDLEREIARLQAVDRFMFPPKKGETGAVTRATGVMSQAAGLPRISGYEVLEELGRGGMGVVYKARQQSLGRLVAMKTLAGSRWSQPGYVDRLRQEAQSLSKINHPNVVKVIDVVDTDHAVSIVLEYVDGESLARKQNGAPLLPRDAAQLMLTLASAIAAVHEQGLLHRDIKPANVLISRTGDVKMTDFGLAKEEGNTTGLTVTGELVGSPGYMAPEQAEGRAGQIDVRTDVYALGATLYEMLTGRPPFVGGSVVETLDHVRHREPVSPRLLNPAVPADLDTICLKCLEKDPLQRIATARELADEVNRFLHGEPIKSRPIGAPRRCWRWCRRRPAAAGLVALSAAAAVVIVALLAANYRNLTEYNNDLTRLNEDLSQAAATAKAMQALAEVRERQTRESLYAANISRAAAAERDGDTRTMLQLLEEFIPTDGERDLRGFEWWYLRRRVGLAHRLLLDVESPIYFLCYSPDGQTMAAAGKDATVRLFDPESGAVSNVIRTGQVEVNGVAFSPDGKEVATAGDDGTICFWDRESGNARLAFKAHPRKAYQLVYSSDGTRIVSCGDNPVIRVFDVRSGDAISSLEGHRDAVQSLVLDRDGKTLASTSSDRTSRLWDLPTGKEVSRVESDRTVGPAALASDRNLLITGTDEGLLESWNLRTRKRNGSVRHLDGMAATALHPNGKLLAAGDKGGSIRLWELAGDDNFIRGHVVSWQAHRGETSALVWSADGSRLISSGGDGRVIGWSLAAARASGPRRFEITAHSSLALIPKSNWLATPGNPLAIWDWRSGKRVAAVDAADYQDVISSLDGRYLAGATSQGDVKLFSIVKTGAIPELKCIAEWHSAGQPRCPRFSPDGSVLAVSRWVGGNDFHTTENAVWLLTCPGFKPIERLPVPGANQIAFAPDGKHLALRVDTMIAMWDTAKERVLWEVPQNDIGCLLFSPDGKFLLARSEFRNVIVRGAADGATRLQFTGHRATIKSLAISRDGRTLATAAENGVVKLSHIPTGRELFDIHSAGVSCVELGFADDGRHLICLIDNHSPTWDREILVFDADEEAAGVE